MQQQSNLILQQQQQQSFNGQQRGQRQSQVLLKEIKTYGVREMVGHVPNLTLGLFLQISEFELLLLLVISFEHQLYFVKKSFCVPQVVSINFPLALRSCGRRYYPL